MPKTILYEWVVETVTTDEFEDIENCDFYDTAADCLRVMKTPPDEGFHSDFALVRNRYDREDTSDLLDRQYAYVEFGKLPGSFDGGAYLPDPYRTELAKALA